MESALRELSEAVELKRWLKEVVADCLGGDGEDVEIKLKVNGRTLDLTESCEEVEAFMEMLDKIVKIRYDWIEEYL